MTARRWPRQMWRCPHRASHRVPVGTVDRPDLELCTDCGAMLPDGRGDAA